MSRQITEDTWARLQDLATEAMGRAYCPYSGYPVGAAALTEDGRVVTGCNVENSAYGVALCAECGLISDLVNTGGGKLTAFVCVDREGKPTSPCGRCRQLLSEHAADGMVLQMPDGKMTMNEVLPGAFGPADLTEITGFDPNAQGR